MDPRLEERIETRSIELFGREYFEEDALIMKATKPQTTVERLNYIKSNTAIFDLKYNQTMAAYQREK